MYPQPSDVDQLTNEEMNPRAPSQEECPQTTLASVAKLTSTSQDLDKDERRLRRLRSERARPPVRRDEYLHHTRPLRCETPMGLLDRHHMETTSQDRH